MMMKVDLNKEIETAKKRIRKTKECAPYIYNEFALLKQAERNLVEAQRKYDEAKRRWDNLGT